MPIHVFFSDDSLLKKTDINSKRMYTANNDIRVALTNHNNATATRRGTPTLFNLVSIIIHSLFQYKVGYSVIIHSRLANETIKNCLYHTVLMEIR